MQRIPLILTVLTVLTLFGGCASLDWGEICKVADQICANRGSDDPRIAQVIAEIESGELDDIELAEEANRRGLDPEPVLEVFDLHRAEVAGLVEVLIRRGLWDTCTADAELSCDDAQQITEDTAMEELREDVGRDLARIQRRQPPPTHYELTSRGYWSRPVVRFLRLTPEGEKAERLYQGR